MVNWHELQFILCSSKSNEELKHVGDNNDNNNFTMQQYCRWLLLRFTPPTTNIDCAIENMTSPLPPISITKQITTDSTTKTISSNYDDVVVFSRLEEEQLELQPFIRNM